WAADWWRSSGLENSRVVALHPGSGTFSLARRWPAERYAVVGAALVDAGHRVLIVAGPGEDALAEEVRAGIAAQRSGAASGPNARGGDRQGPFEDGKAGILGPQTTPRHLGALLRRCDLFVGNDSGVMHLAAAVGIPS